MFVITNCNWQTLTIEINIWSSRYAWKWTRCGGSFRNYKTVKCQWLHNCRASVFNVCFRLWLHVPQTRTKFGDRTFLLLVSKLGTAESISYDASTFGSCKRCLKTHFKHLFWLIFNVSYYAVMRFTLYRCNELPFAIAHCAVNQSAPILTVQWRFRAITI